MGNIFINQDETIKVNVWVGEDSKNKTRYWSRESDRPENILSETRYEAVFRKPNFRDSTVLLDLGIRMNSEGGMDLAFNEIRYRRLEILLKSWTLKDSEDNIVPANAESIASLHPSFAMVLSGALERELGIEEGTFEDDLEAQVEQSQVEQDITVKAETPVES